jgi:hypothetical protein
MHDEPETTQWSEAEAATLAALREPATPAPGLEERVLDGLEARRLVQRKRSFLSPRFRPFLAAAAAVFLFLAGRSVGQRQITAADPVTGPRFMILVFEDGSYEAAPPGREAERVAEYSTWAGQLAERGVPVEGDELLNEGVTVEGAGAYAVLQDGVPTTSAGRLAGFFIVGEDDLDSAVGLARATPHLRHGGRVAVVPLAGH